MWAATTENISVKILGAAAMPKESKPVLKTVGAHHKFEKMPVDI